MCRPSADDELNINITSRNRTSQARPQRQQQQQHVRNKLQQHRPTALSIRSIRPPVPPMASSSTARTPAATTTTTPTRAAARAHKEVLAGSVAAVASTLVCHPIDVLRTELQTQAQATTARACLRRIVEVEGVRGLYKGLSAPLAAQAVYKAVIFGANSAAREALLARQQRKRKRQRPDDATPVVALAYPDTFLCGMAAGGANALVVAPVELVRSRLVVLRGRYRGPLDCARDILRHEGGLPALWRGLVPTLCRDGPGVGAWFLAFAWGKDCLLALRRQRERAQGPTTTSGSLGVWELLLAGSFAGVAFWTVALPFDTVKAVVQVQRPSQQQHNGGMLAVALRLVREEGGIRRLFRGWQGAFGRAIPGSAATLAVYDIVKDKL